MQCLPSCCSFQQCVLFVASSAALLMCRRRESALRRWPATVEVEVLLFVTQFTAELLSQKSPVCTYCSDIGVMPSKMSHASSVPAVSRSLINIDPCLFASDTTSCCRSWSHSNIHTKKFGKEHDPYTHTPPAANFDAST